MSLLYFRNCREMPRKRKNIQAGKEKRTLKTSQVEKTQVQNNPEERSQQDNDNERISCKCNKLWKQNRLLAHIKRDKKCGSKYTEQEIEDIKKVSKENNYLRKVAKRKEIQNDAEKKKIHNKKEALRKRDARAKIQNDVEKHKIKKQNNSTRMGIARAKARAKIQNDVRERLIKFRRECQYGPIFTCICCMRDLFRKTVKKVTAAYLNSIGMVKEYLQIDENGDLKNDLKVHGEHYICQNCCRYLQKGEMPLICAKNGLEYAPIPSCLQIENLERQMICKDLVFIKIRHLPSYSRMPAINDHVINVPIDDDDIIKTVTSLPRTKLTNGLVTVGLKRDMAIKKFHKLQLIRPDKICEAISYLKENHPSYANIDILSLDEWRKQFYAEECDDTENTGENTEDDSSNASQIVEEAPEKSIYNFATCLIPDNPLSDVVGKYIF